MAQGASDAGGKIGKTSEKAVLLADRLTGAEGAGTIGTDERNGGTRYGVMESLIGKHG